MPAWMHILRLRSGILYPGVTQNLGARLHAQFQGTACRTTRLDPPVALVYSEKYETLAEARRRENQIKRWSRTKKEALISGDINRLKGLSKSRKRK